MKILVVNRSNNMGDAMCQMRILKEYKDANPTFEYDFITCHFLHYLMATHTDLFRQVIYDVEPQVNAFAAGYSSNGYDRLLEFTVDWGEATQIGILKAWAKRTLNFIPSTDKPYFLLREEEKITAKAHFDFIMKQAHPNKPAFRKSIVLSLESVSDPNRGFQQSDWNRVIDMIPNDVAIFYPTHVAWIYGKPLADRPNLFVIPGYPIGESGALSQLVDVVFTVHSGPVMLAYACDAKKIIQVNFSNGGGPNLVKIPQSVDLLYENNQKVNWEQLQQVINENL